MLGCGCKLKGSCWAKGLVVGEKQTCCCKLLLASLCLCKVATRSSCKVTTLALVASKQLRSKHWVESTRGLLGCEAGVEHGHLVSFQCSNIVVIVVVVDLGEKWIGGVKIKLSGLLGVVWAVYIGVDMVGNAFGRGRSLLQAGGGAAAVVGR